MYLFSQDLPQCTTSVKFCQTGLSYKIVIPMTCSYPFRQPNLKKLPLRKKVMLHNTVPVYLNLHIDAFMLNLLDRIWL